METEASSTIFPYVLHHHPFSQSFIGDGGGHHNNSFLAFVLIVESRWPLSSVFTKKEWEKPASSTPRTQGNFPAGEMREAKLSLRRVLYHA